MGFELTAAARVEFTERPTAKGRTVAVPSLLPRLSPAHALATVTLPLHLNWTEPARTFDLRDRSHRAHRAHRARVYAIVLREGADDDVLTHIDGVLLVELWNDLVLPRDIRAA